MWPWPKISHLLRLPPMTGVGRTRCHLRTGREEVIRRSCEPGLPLQRELTFSQTYKQGFFSGVESGSEPILPEFCNTANVCYDIGSATYCILLRWVTVSAAVENGIKVDAISAAICFRFLSGIVRRSSRINSRMKSAKRRSLCLSLRQSGPSNPPTARHVWAALPAGHSTRKVR